MNAPGGCPVSLLGLHVSWAHHCVYPQAGNQPKSPLLLAFSGWSSRSERFPKILKDIKHQLTLVSSPFQFRGYILPLKHTKWPDWWQLTNWRTCWPGYDIPQAAPADPDLVNCSSQPTAHFLGIHTQWLLQWYGSIPHIVVKCLVRTKVHPHKKVGGIDSGNGCTILWM